MTEVAVVTDSTCYLPAALVDSLGITVVSRYYDLGAGWLRELEFDGDFRRFHADLDASKSVAKTSPATVEDFVAVFERLLQQHSAVVAVLISSGIGSVLDLKPILTVELETKAIERVRTRRRGVDRLVELMRQLRAVGADRWFIQHTDAHQDAKRLTERLDELFGTEPEFVSELGPVVATHFGPGLLVAGGLPGAALDGVCG